MAIIRASGSLKKLREERESANNKKAKNRRSFILKIAGGIAVIPLSAGYLYRHELSAFARADILGKPSFEDARKLPNYRQRFLDNILKDTEIPYCDGVVYDGDGSKVKYSLEEGFLKIKLLLILKKR